MNIDLSTGNALNRADIFGLHPSSDDIDRVVWIHIIGSSYTLGYCFQYMKVGF